MRRMRWWWVLPGIILMSIALFAIPVGAQTEVGDRVIFGQSYTLRSGHRLKGDLAIFGGSATLERNSVVAGDILIAGGSLSVAGRVEGDIAVMGGSVSLLPTAYVDGDVSVLGGSVDRAEGAIVTGQLITGLTWQRSLPFAVPPPTLPEFSVIPARVSGADLLVSFLLRLIGAFLLAAMLSAIALIVLSFGPNVTLQVGRALETSPILTFIIGLVTLILAAGAVLLMALTICLIPIAFLLTVGLLLAMVFGWIALGWLIGDRVLRALNVEEPNPLLAGVIGVALITLVSRVPCLGGIFLILGASAGLGAVVLTRMGTQPYPIRRTA